MVTSKQSSPKVTVSLKMPLMFLEVRDSKSARQCVGCVVTSLPSGKCFQDSSSGEPSFKASRCFCGQCCSESDR